MEARDKQDIDHVAIIRMEQLYPLATNQLAELKKKYPKAEWIWAQEEPRNMGAWAFIQDNLGEMFNLDVIARKRSASPWIQKAPFARAKRTYSNRINSINRNKQYPMAIIEMKVPELAESITEVTLAQFLISDGDVVEMDQPICEMETDKASQELFAEKAGKVTFVAEEGADLAVGALICTIDTSVAPAPKTRRQQQLQKAAPQEKAAPVVEAEEGKLC